MDNENTPGAAPFTTADNSSPGFGNSPHMGGLPYSPDGSGYYPTDYSLPGKFINWLTGNTTAGEKANDLINQNKAFQWSADEAAKNRAFEAFMSDTAISRAVKDAERNGINKFYLLNSGLTASTPSGSAASGSYDPLTANKSKSGLSAVLAAVLGAAAKALLA